MAPVVAPARVFVVALGLALVALVVGPGLAGVGASTRATWSNVALLPGLVALDPAGNSSASALSCPTGTSCVVGGSDEDRSSKGQGFLDSMKSGVWQGAIPVPDLSSLNVGGSANVDAVGCSSAGNCSAVGTYANTKTGSQAFVVNEVNGRWNNAEPLPGAATLESQSGDPWAGSFVISCVTGAKLDCGLGGDVYKQSHIFEENNPERAVVDSEVSGVWLVATFVPWPTSDAVWKPSSFVQAIACPAAGDCTIVVNTDTDPIATFVDHDTNNRWVSTGFLPGLSQEIFIYSAAVNVAGFGLSCPALGDCVIAGTYLNYSEPFTATETRGHWSPVTGVPGINAINVSNYAQANDVSCGSVGNCAVDGDYLVTDGDAQSQLVFVTSEVSGRWRDAQEIPGLSTLTTYLADSTGLSCDPGASCVAMGYFDVSRGDLQQSFVDSSVDGRWGDVTRVPGLAYLHATSSQPTNVVCSADELCTLFGTFTTSTNGYGGQVYSSKESRATS